MNDKKKQLLYMSTHRGCKEMDIILGEFAQSEIYNLNQEEILLYENLLNQSDDHIFKMISNIIYNIELKDVQRNTKALLVKIAKFHTLKDISYN